MTETRSRIQRIPLLEDIVTDPRLCSHYQPIVRLGDPPDRIGFEALARYQDDMPLARPDLLFEYANRKKMTEDLDLACVRRAVEGGTRLPEGGLLFINLQPKTLENGRRLLELIEKSGVSPSRIVLELTEHVTFSDVEAAVSSSESLRALGVRFAFDDVGSGFSHLILLERIAPEFIKLADEFGTGFEQSQFKRKIIEHQMALARDFGASVILEGIETPETAAAAMDLGIEYGQGWHFARPAPAERWS